MPALLSPERPTHVPLSSGEPQRDVCLDADDPVDDLSALRLVPVPDVGPPFDGETLASAPACARAGQGTIGHNWGYPSAEAGADTAERSESPGEWPRHFARLLTEALAGARPVRQILPWTSDRARGHLRKLMPLFAGGQRPRVLRVIATRPTRDVIEMTVIVSVGTRTRALAIRLEHMTPPRHLARHADRPIDGTRANPTTPAALRWVCTDIEAA
jgi:Family of unknown function (DUF6459)